METFDLSTATGASKSASRPRLKSSEQWIWLNAAAIGASLCALFGMLLLLFVKGSAHFWPADIAQIDYTNTFGESRQLYGRIIEVESVPIEQFLESGRSLQGAAGESATVERWLVKSGSRRLNPPDFRWVFSAQVNGTSYPKDLTVFQRMEWGDLYGMPLALSAPNEPEKVFPRTSSDSPALLMEKLQRRLEQVRETRRQIASLESGEVRRISVQLEEARSQLRFLNQTADSIPNNQLLTQRVQELEISIKKVSMQLRKLYENLDRGSVYVQLAQGSVAEIKLAELYSARQPNQMSTLSKASTFIANIGSFLTENPREANTEGGVFPAIFGTVLMVLLMSVMVAPLGVITAIYLHEYAKSGVLVSVLRIAINNLAGVPSIVFGVFGLGFFVYFLGGNIDQLFFPEKLPSPTFGTPGLLWASLTLALLTLPVVIVSTEEGLTRVPRSMREGGLALGATKAETLFSIVLPAVRPAILTGVILAIARAAGEVAPLMLVGVVKLAPALAVDSIFPYLHLDRKFMHLGFHIYDVGFQSPNIEAARPLVYATALVLVGLIVGLNLAAITLRNRLEHLYKDVET